MKYPITLRNRKGSNKKRRYRFMVKVNEKLCGAFVVGQMTLQ